MGSGQESGLGFLVILLDRNKQNDDTEEDGFFAIYHHHIIYSGERGRAVTLSDPSTISACLCVVHTSLGAFYR